MNDGGLARFVVYRSGESQMHANEKKRGKVGPLLPASDKARRGIFYTRVER